LETIPFVDGKPLPAEALGTSITFKEFTDAGVMVSVGDGPPREVSFYQGGSRLSIDQYIGSETNNNFSPNGPKQAVTP
jgi:hypothetical protein